MKKIGLVALSNPAWMGGINYVINWVKALNLLPLEERPAIFLLYRDERGKKIAETLSSYAEDIRDFKDASALGLDIVYPVTQVFEAPFDCPWAGWVPDWQCKHLPEMFDELELARRDLHFGILARKSPVLSVSSQMAYEDTLRLWGDQTTALIKLPFPAVIDQEVYDYSDQEISEVIKKYNLPSKFFLVCNKFWKHKNAIVVFRALKKTQDADVQCVFTGDTTDQRWPEYFAKIKKIIKETGVAERVHLIGQVSRKDQLKLLRAAHAIVQPSKFEGWSSVVEESKALSKALIVSSFPVHFEQAEGFGRFFDPDDADGLSRHMLESWNLSAPAAMKADVMVGKVKHEEYIRKCARQFIILAEMTSRNYNPKVNDPKAIIANMLPILHEKKEIHPWGQLYQRSIGGTRMIFNNNRDQLKKLMENIRIESPGYYESAKRDILGSIDLETEPSNLQKARPFVVKMAKKLMEKCFNLKADN